MSAQNSDFYREGVARMVSEGVDIAEKIIEHMKEHKDELDALARVERKKALLAAREDFITFSQIHPIVYEYLVSERIFNHKAFGRYIQAAFGAPRSAEQQELMSKDKRNVYYIKNKQYALYYKYLLQETNPHLKIAEVNRMYDEVVAELDASTSVMLDKYEAARKKTEITNDQLTEEKRHELLVRLKQQLEMDARS